AKIFPIFFFLVAALVALTTMTRMIEEERGQIGALKSFGYSNFGILKYYLIYSFSASAIGVVLGLGGGFIIFPSVISKAYDMMYNLPPITTKVIWPIALIVGGITIFCIMATAYLACRSELKEKPAALLLPKAPKLGKRILLERITPIWKRIKFTRKVTLRNLFRYKKRFLMTIMGVAGCFALLLTGFGLRDSIGDIVNKQYGEIDRYNYILELNQEPTETLAVPGEYLLLHEVPVSISAKEKSERTTLDVPKDQEKLSDFVFLRERKSHEALSLKDDGVILTEKMSENLQVKVGDQVTIKLADGRKTEMKVSGIAENYVSSYAYINENTYKQAFGDSTSYTRVLIKSDEENLAEKLLKDNDAGYVLSIESIKDSFKDSVKSIDYIVVVLILSAGALAVIVLYNLTNVNICERKKELATIKVLGFFEKEVSAYIFREINILSGIGMVVGIPLGILLHRFVMKTAEVDAVMFGRHIYWQSYLYAAAITIFFTIVVNLIMRRSIRKIDMVESMKAND
ncbi:MAG: FtsX-like permease family protein, partial [Anaerovoracaceae bacterium]